MDEAGINTDPVAIAAEDNIIQLILFTIPVVSKMHTVLDGCINMILLRKIEFLVFA